ncbi:CHAT domain-containing protein [Tengunoibacter tsumagoiensis]|nr:CHAT domain-containing protein [Tengunoibacter tsumagoiensis]
MAPFIRFTQIPGSAEQWALFGFSLPLFSALHENVKGQQAPANPAEQIHLLRMLWQSGVVGLDLRFLKTASAELEVGLLCRIHVFQASLQQFHADCHHLIQHIQQLFTSQGYPLQSITTETQFEHFLRSQHLPFQAEVRRFEEIFYIDANRMTQETYATIPWKARTIEQIYLKLLTPQTSLLSIYLEPTRLTPAEEMLLTRVSSPATQQFLRQVGKYGQRAAQAYHYLAANLHHPFLLRVAVAATSQQQARHMAEAIRQEVSGAQDEEVKAVIQYPDHPAEKQALQQSLQMLCWRPWGNKRESMEETGRLRYLVDAQTAHTIFRLPPRRFIMPPKTNVLFVQSDPTSLPHLRLAADERAIKEAIQLSRYRDNIAIQTCPDSTIHDLRRALLNDTFHIIHISGHGTGEGLILVNEQGQQISVPPLALAKLFEAYKDHLHCVVLSACYSSMQAKLMTTIPYVIAMNGPVGDQAAREFSRGFYDALGAGKDIPFAYEEGCRSAALSASLSTFAAQIFAN